MIFEFSWSDYETYIPYILEGEEKTREEFEADCNKALKESFDEYMSNVGGCWASLDGWTSYAVRKIQEYGYTLIKPMSFGYSGLALPKHDRYTPSNDELDKKEYEEQFPEFLNEIAKMIVHNDALDKVLYKDIYKRIDEENKMDKVVTNKIVVEAEKKDKVFLGGTCAESTWREELIEQLEIDYFNPVVEDWTPECMEEEVRQRESCDYVLYVITSAMKGVYSIAEVVDDSNKRPAKTVFCVLEDGFNKGELKSLGQVEVMVEENGATVCDSLEDVASYLNEA